MCQKYNIPAKGTIFLKEADEIEKIIRICLSYDISINYSLFINNAEKIENIANICIENNIPFWGTIFIKKSEEVQNIIDLCQENNIPIRASIFIKSYDELQEIINYVKNEYGQQFLTGLIINKKVNYLKEVLPYLKSLGLLEHVISSASILSLSLDEIRNRKELIEKLDESLVLQSGRFNSIFGLSKKNYNLLKNEIFTYTKK